MGRTKTKIDEDTIVGAAPLAHLLDLTDKRIRELASEGVIERVAHGQYLLQNSVRAYVRYLRELASAKSNTNEQKDWEHHRARRMSASADILELDLEKMRGNLVPADEIAPVWDEVLSLVRSKLMAIAARGAPLTFAAKNIEEHRGVLDGLAREILTEISETPIEADEDPAEVKPDKAVATRKPRKKRAKSRKSSAKNDRK